LHPASSKLFGWVILSIVEWMEITLNVHLFSEEIFLKSLVLKITQNLGSIFYLVVLEMTYSNYKK